LDPTPPPDPAGTPPGVGDGDVRLMAQRYDPQAVQPDREAGAGHLARTQCWRCLAEGSGETSRTGP